MTSYRVVTEQVATQAITLESLGGELQGASTLIARAADAAADTPAEAPLAGATMAWIQVLGQYGDATHGLANAVALAAQCYAATDGSVVPGG